jgi:hypothetical protein
MKQPLDQLIPFPSLTRLLDRLYTTALPPRLLPHLKQPDLPQPMDGRSLLLSKDWPKRNDGYLDRTGQTLLIPQTCSAY